ncbi:MAG: CTP synthase [Patescibacteria group bacterium]
MLKYIFVSGGVISGIGKGTTVASIALLLKSAGYKVTPLKFENYLNVDAGTINPIEHGDPFLCEDGTEADMDIGSYEKYLDQQMGKVNFVTMGQIYKEVIDRERRFEYNGEDVEAIPHITNEIINRINIAAKKTKSEIIIIELGGTAGEYQNVFYYEASRILTLKNPKDVIHIHVSYIPTPIHLGEPKTKPTQLSVRTLNALGIQPDILIARSENPLDKRRKDRLALFCNLNTEAVISNHNVKSVYEIPLILNQQNISRLVQTKLSLKYKKPQLAYWEKLIKKIKSHKKNKINIAIIGKYFGTGEYQLKDSYAALFDAIDHASWFNNCEVETNWIDAEEIEKKGVSIIGSPDGIIVPIGWGERGAEGMTKTAGYAREKKIPYLGLCYGMQHAVISYARDILNLNKADTTENRPNTKHPVIHLIPTQHKILKNRAYGGTMRLGAWDAKVIKNTQAYEIYDKHNSFIEKSKGITSERHRHRYEFNNKYINDFKKAGLVISAVSVDEGLVEIIELPKNKHPFYIGTQGHPEYKSKPNNPHPIFIEFINSCLKNRN